MDSLPVAQEGRVAIALVDEPAHLSTALIVLLAVGGPGLLWRHRTFSISATAGAVLIDLDHIPLYAGVPGISMPGGRPYSHSLTTPVLLMLLACTLPRAREVFIGLSCGTLLHFVRDVATGPGLPLFWPFDDGNQLLPYAVYFSVIAVLAGLATARLWPTSERRRRLPRQRAWPARLSRPLRHATGRSGSPCRPPPSGRHSWCRTS